MSDSTERLLGEVNGKLDTMIALVREHVKQDEDRFKEVDTKLVAHAAVINQAKGAKTMLFIFAGFVSFAVSFLMKYLGGH